MNLWMELFSQPGKDAWLLALLLNAALKSLLVLALATGICAVWQRASATTRHLIWFLALACLALLPVLTLSLPTKQKALWSVSAGHETGNAVSLKLEFLSGIVPETTAAASHLSQSGEKLKTSVGEPAMNDQKFTTHVGTNWLAFAVFVWGTGVLGVLAALVAGQFRLRKHRRNARQLQTAEWLALLAETGEIMRLSRAVTLLQSAENTMPLTWGWWRPVVLLPGEAENWPIARRRIVLLHELAHIRRRDCLTQFVAELVCAFYWFNPLVWLAAREMRAERERACDDLVLNAGCKASDYAGHLVEIAENYRRATQLAAVAMARPSGLRQRVEAVLDGNRNRSRGARLAMACLTATFLGLGWLVGSQAAESLPSAWSLKNSAVAAQLEQFVTAKRAQEAALLKADEQDFTNSYDRQRHTITLPDCQPFFDAANAFDWLAVSNHFSQLQKGTLGIAKATNGYPHGMWLKPVMETFGAVEAFAAGNGKYSEMFGNEVIQSIPQGSIYFGGTDPGRFIITSMQKSQINGDPFFTLTQNALADGSYLEYLRLIYGDKIYIPTSADSQKCFETYVADIRKRSESNQLKPGENIKIDQGRVQISGRVAVMEINGLLAKAIFDHETNRDFYIEESFPLDWMYSHLEPHGLIFKINRQPLADLSEAMVQKDRDYWQPLVAGMIGGWMKDDTSVETIVQFAEKVFLRHDLNGFTGDPGFVQNEYTRRMFAKLRSSIAGLYAWRAEHANTGAEKERMTRAADFAFRQALALCPGNPETAEGYGTFLKNLNHEADAQLVQKLAAQFTPKAASQTEPTAKASFFQIRLVVDEPANDTEQMIHLTTNLVTGRVYSEKLYVQKLALLDEAALRSAKLIKGPQGDQQIEIRFTDDGRKQFARITREHLHQRLAIIIDGKLMEAPVIQSEISSGIGQITGSFSEAEAQALTAKINEAIQE